MSHAVSRRCLSLGLLLITLTVGCRSAQVRTPSEPTPVLDAPMEPMPAVPSLPPAAPDLGPGLPVVPPEPESDASAPQEQMRKSTLPAGFEDDSDHDRTVDRPIRVRVVEPDGPVARIDIPEFVSELQETPRALAVEPSAQVAVVPLPISLTHRGPVVDWPPQGLPWNIAVVPGPTAAR